VAGLTITNFYFPLFDGAIKSAQVIELLRHLTRRLPGRLLIVWDGAGIHRSRAVREFVTSLGPRLYLAYLPAHAPELAPSEYLWGHLKQHELTNFCAHHGWDLTEEFGSIILLLDYVEHAQYKVKIPVVGVAPLSPQGLCAKCSNGPRWGGARLAGAGFAAGRGKCAAAAGRQACGPDPMSYFTRRKVLGCVSRKL